MFCCIYAVYTYNVASAGIGHMLSISTFQHLIERRGRLWHCVMAHVELQRWRNCQAETHQAGAAHG